MAYRLERMFPVLSVFITVACIAAVLWIVNKRMNPSYKLAWTMLILSVPVFGAVIYLIFGKSRLASETQKKFDNEVKKTDVVLKEKKDVRENLNELDYHMDNQSKYIRDYAGFPVYQNTETEYFRIGEELYKSLIQELEKAEHFIFMEYFIIDKGMMWESVLEILVRKVAEGVDVRLIYDDMGCVNTLPAQFYKQLQAKGIKCAAFNPFRPIVSVIMNNRDHRKITVIDGHTSFTGGINLADEYINRKKRFGHWKDSGIRIDGPATQAFTRLFLMNWYINRGEISDFDQYHLENQTRLGSGLCIPYGSGPKPIYKTKVGKIVYQNLINQAEDFVYITTPYLIIDYDLTEDIKNAAMRGVDVRIVTPHIPDKKLIQLVTRGAYPDLLSAGVRIFEYTPGFIHSKQMIVDDRFAAVGTINLDYRSLVHHYENAVLLYKTESIADIRKDFEGIFEQSQEIFSDTINPTWYQMMIKEVTQLFAPML